MKILWVAGARPNFMKIAPIWRATLAFNAGRTGAVDRFEPMLVHTGQHYDANMSDIFFRDLALPQPHYFLGVGGGSHAEQTARILVEFEKLLQSEKPAMVGVVGDVNSTAACALATAKSYVLPGGRTPALIHVEAGLRSGDRLMPEEINRIVTDALADLLFTSEESGTANLLREGIPAERIHFAGNVMVDSLYHALARADERRSHLSRPDPSRYGLVTLHRPSNVDDPQMLTQVIEALSAIGRQCPVFFPVHPRTRRHLARLKLAPEDPPPAPSPPGAPPGLHFLAPLGYDDFLAYMRGATFVITDSGGVQEETTVLGIPCLTLRDNTERPATVTIGTNMLLGRNPSRIIPEVEAILAGRGKRGERPPLWDGRAAERIVSYLARFLEAGR